ncbi:MAG: pyridoxamine 5'-phosphate oxidase family protein [Bacteroidota bacterium]
MYKEVISSEEELRAIIGSPSKRVMEKSIDYVDDNSKLFISKSPFICIASSDGQGNHDVSPKGDPAGFVKVLDKKTLAIPDRLGNRRMDTFANLLKHPGIGLIFFIPGIRETLRVNGRAKIVADQALREELAYEGKLPQLVLIVHIEEVFIHCAKCIMRSKLWGEVAQEQIADVPSLGKFLKDMGKVEETVEEFDAHLEKIYKDTMY